MTEQFYTILTQIGKAKIANATALGQKVDFANFALGDGGGSYYNPIESQVELRNQVWKGKVGSVVIDEDNPNWIVLENIIPSSIGGFMIREAGVFDCEGDLIAIGKYPETYKPIAESGSAKDLIIKMVIEVANAEVVNLKIDPTIILATKKDIDILSNRLKKVEDDIDIKVSEHNTSEFSHPHIQQEIEDTKSQLNENANNLNIHIADFLPHGIDNAGFRNSIYRGKYLGNTVTATQYTNIQNGSFKDMYIGDYWTINGTDYVIAAFNYYLGVGDIRVTVNHITLISRVVLYNHIMNDTNITTGGYVGSKMYISGLEQAKTKIKADFPNHVLKHRKLLSNATVDGKASSWAWVDSEIDLMTEVMAYGSVVWGESTIGGSGYNIGEGKTQLPLFALRPDMISNRLTYWLRDVVSGTRFAYVSSSGDAAAYLAASSAFGVRPTFSIS